MDVTKKDVHQVSREREKLLEEFSSTVSLHGFHFLVEERGIRRLLWFLITAFSFFFSAILFYSIFTDYLKYKTYTTFSTTYDEVDAVFPTLTFCPINTVSKSKLDQIPDTHNISTMEFIDIFTRVYPKISEEGFNWSDTRTQELFAKLTKQNVTLVQQMVDIYDSDLPSMVEDDIVKVFSPQSFCHFDGKICTVQDFHKVTSSGTSMCLQFNSYKGNKTLKMKSLYASEFILYMNLNVEDSEHSKYPFEGMSIFINSYGTPHQDTKIRTQKLFVTTGTINHIKLSLKKVKLLPPPYFTDCGSKEYHLVRNYPYSKAMCQLDCILDIVHQKCGCLGYGVQDYVDVKICGIKDFRCYLEQRELVAHNQTKYCDAHCPLECEHTTYDISTSQASLGNEDIYYQLLELPKFRNMTKKEIRNHVRQNVVGIIISFNDFSVLTETVLPAVSWNMLLGSIGGSIGLCLGFSLITVMEFLFFLYDYVTIPWKSKRRIHVETTNTDENTT